MGFPLATVPVLNAIVFSVNEICKIKLGFLQDNSLFEGMITGSIAGFANSFIVTPVELVKCRLQVQRDDKNHSKYKGINDCLKKIYSERGFKGIYQGNVITVIREVVAYGAQFGSYYYVKNYLAHLQNTISKNLDIYSIMIAGAFSGFVCWFVSFPQDVIKTKLQLDIECLRYKRICYDGGIIHCSREIYLKEGKYVF
jgi:solute carrier family 25 carnitine/acylcarnitine transporter 20/29